MEPPRRSIGVRGLVVIGFFWVSGGVYGNEALVAAAPPLFVLLFLLLLPFGFSLPIALITAELSVAFPADGGQAAWVAQACGPTLGAQNAYYVWASNVIDAAVYPLLASGYAAGFARSALGWSVGWAAERAMCLLMVAVLTLCGLRGVEWIERAQGALFVATLLPCVLLVVAGLPSLRPSAWLDAGGYGGGGGGYGGDGGAVGGGGGGGDEGEEEAVDWPLLLSWVLWLYSGFSSLGSLAGEVAAPQRTYPRAICVLFPLVVGLNLAPFLVCLSVDSERRHYVESDGYFATIAGRLAGPWLATLFSGGAFVSLFGLYTSQMVVADRTLFAALDRRARTTTRPARGDEDEDGVPTSAASAGLASEDAAAGLASEDAAAAAAAAAAVAEDEAPTATSSAVADVAVATEMQGGAGAGAGVGAGVSAGAGAGAGAAWRRWLLELPISGVPRVFILADAAAVCVLVVLDVEALVERVTARPLSRRPDGAAPRRHGAAGHPRARRAACEGLGRPSAHS